MRYTSFLFGVMLLGGWLVGSVQAQVVPAMPDSMRQYDLDEIVVSTSPAGARETYTVHRVALRELERQNAAVVADLVRAIPAAFVQTNSRGESLIYLRNAGERQVALFYNGASLNVPWDNRLSVDMIPTGMVGNLTIAKGVPSILYGTNVLGGAINMTSRRLDSDGHETFLNGHYGSLEDTRLNAGHLFARGPLQVGVAAGYLNREGIPLADRSQAPFSQSDDRIRTNTDREMLNLYGHADYRFRGGAQAGFTLTHVDGQYGVAPESHLNPDSATVRFWRYPDWRQTMAILNTTVPIGVTTVLKGAAWAGVFGQTIDQFGTVAYDLVEARQQDDDRTAGLRLSAIHSMGPHQLTLAFNGLTSEHDQLDLGLDDAGQLVSDNGTQSYQQHVFSAGAEVAFQLSDPLKWVVGGSLDGIATPKTGNKPARDPLVDYAFNTGLSYAIDEVWTARVSAGRKVRFPTLRELFGEALNRFLLNPDLRPETSLVTEAGIAGYRHNWQGEFVLFHYRIFDTIDQRNVEVDGRRLRQRINLDGSRVTGAEIAGRYDLDDRWTLEGHAAVMDSRALLEGETTRLTEKPDMLGALTVEYAMPNGLKLLVRGEATGRAYGRAEDNSLLALPRSLAIDARAGYGFELAGPEHRHLEVYLRADNLTNATVLHQLGLPGAGRMVSAGLALRL